MGRFAAYESYFRMEVAKTDVEISDVKSDISRIRASFMHENESDYPKWRLEELFAQELESHGYSDKLDSLEAVRKALTVYRDKMEREGKVVSREISRRSEPFVG